MLIKIIQTNWIIIEWKEIWKDNNTTIGPADQD